SERLAILHARAEESKDPRPRNVRWQKRIEQECRTIRNPTTQSELRRGRSRRRIAPPLGARSRQASAAQQRVRADLRANSGESSGGSCERRRKRRCPSRAARSAAVGAGRSTLKR